MPEYRVTDATRTALRTAPGRCARGSRTSARVDDRRGRGRARRALPRAGQPASATPVPYEESRATYTLGAGESTDVVLRCGFEPQVLDVDPDALVLQLRRKDAIVRF